MNIGQTENLYTILTKTAELRIYNFGDLNASEKRLVDAVFDASEKGERLISIQLAERLGVTRSAISQAINRLEEKQILQRVKDKKDKKIAYIEFTPAMRQSLDEQKASILAGLQKAMEKMGSSETEYFIRSADKFLRLYEEAKG